MKKIVFTCLYLIMCIGIAAQEYTYTSVSGDPMGVRIYTLDNGLKVYTSVNKETPRITAHIAVNTGSRNDPAEYTGLAHYLEHLMFKGTPSFGTTDYAAERPYLDAITALYEEYYLLTDSIARRQKYHEIDSLSQCAAQYNIPNEYDKMMTLIGSEDSNAYTSYDVTCYTEDIPANELDRWAQVEAERFQHLVLRGFHTELEAVYEEKNISMASDWDKLLDASMRKMFPSHSYGTQTVLGTQEHLKSPSLVAIQDYYDRYYVPNNCAIILAGDFDPDSAIATIDKYFGAWQRGERCAPRPFAPQPTFTSPQDSIVVGQEQEELWLSWRFAAPTSLQHDTLAVLAKVLYNGTAGLLDLDLNQQLRVQEAEARAHEMKDYSLLRLEAVPKEGQTLSDVRSLLLSEVEKVKQGAFDEELLTAINNNERLLFLRRMEHNFIRARLLVNAFINGEDWAQNVAALDRQARISKDDIVAFAQRHLTDGYVCVEKRRGEDTTIKKIDKPEITPIPANRDYASDYLTAYAAQVTEPIHPVFVDFDKELTFFDTTNGLPVIYKQNDENALFTLRYQYPFGSAADHRYKCAFDFVDLLGTDSLSSEEIKKQFYALACDYSTRVDSKVIDITLTGLQENMPAAVALLDNLLQHAVPDDTVYQQYVQQVVQSRHDAVLEQRSNAQHLLTYGCLGARNQFTNTMTTEELRTTAPAVLTTLLRSLSGIKHSVHYYGPATQEELDAILTSAHTLSAVPLAAAPANEAYTWTATPTSDILLAPYDANNTIIYMYHNEGKPFDASEVPLVYLFNEYFGAGMNSVVFQELRETKGLAYNAWATYNTPDYKEDPEYLLLSITTQNDKMMDCLRTFADITTNLPQDEASLAIARESLIKYVSALRITKFDIIDTYLAYQRLGIDYDINRLLYEQIPLLTMDDLLRFARENIIGKPLRYMILGNEEDLDVAALETLGSLTRVPLAALYAQ